MVAGTNNTRARAPSCAVRSDAPVRVDDPRSSRIRNASQAKSERTPTMRNASLLVPLALSVAACGSSESGKGSSKGSTNSPATMSADAFSPPALQDGYIRLQAQTITDIPAGADVTHCQYVMAP